jgi:hypothetical protein
MLLYCLFYVPILFIAWALVFPMQATAMIENLKQWQAHFIVQHLISKDMHLLRERIQKWGKLHGYEQGLIDEILDTHSVQITQRLKSRYSRVDFDEWFQ